MSRNPNTVCDLNGCGNEFYRRPSQKKKFNQNFCSRSCYQKSQSKDPRDCLECGDEFIYNHIDQNYCSSSCASKGVWSNATRFTKKTNKTNNPSKQKRIKLLKAGADRCCSVEGCKYSKTLDVHRIVPGSDGGDYEIGNMFMICPNHHAEVTRGLIELHKEDNFTLSIVEVQNKDPKRCPSCNGPKSKRASVCRSCYNS